MTAIPSDIPRKPDKVAFWNDPKIRGLFFQGVTIVIVAWAVYAAFVNARDALLAQKIASGFGFLNEAAGYEIGFSILPFTAADTHFRAFLVGITNTLLVAVIGVIFATLLGFLIGIARLSSNWLIAKLATIYVEFFRNIPLLLILVFLSSLKVWFPQPTDMAKSLGEQAMAAAKAAGLAEPEPQSFWFLATLRGLFVPRVIFESGAIWTFAAALIAIVSVVLLRRFARNRQAATGQRVPVLWLSLALLFGLPLLVFVASGMPMALDYVTAKSDPTAPIFRRHQLIGGFEIVPEFFALLIGLIIYTAAFIAENVRAGIMAVSKGQTEASQAVGLTRAQTLKLVIIPQALRVIIPPLTNQYLNLTKNSSLATAIGYPDLYLIFAGSTLSLSNQAVEVIAMTMAVYLTISLLTSFVMNWYNTKKAIVER
jgi:general L-amino acid transport system permease protein